MDALPRDDEGFGDSNDNTDVSRAEVTKAEGDTKSQSKQSRVWGKKRKNDGGQSRPKRHSMEVDLVQKLAYEIAMADEIADAIVRASQPSYKSIAVAAGAGVQKVLLAKTGSSELVFDVMEAIKDEFEFFLAQLNDHAAWKMICKRIGIDPDCGI